MTVSEGISLIKTVSAGVRTLCIVAVVAPGGVAVVSVVAPLIVVVVVIAVVAVAVAAAAVAVVEVVPREFLEGPVEAVDFFPQLVVTPFPLIPVRKL